MKLLATTDGSPRSLTAVAHAARLARALDAELVLCRVLDPRADCAHVQATSLNEAVRVVTEEWTVSLSESLEVYRQPSRVVIAQKRRGEPVHSAILRVAAEEGAAIVAMSTRGSGMLRHVVLGSVALEVVKRADIPVLLTGDHAVAPSDDGPYRILVTSDGSRDSCAAVAAVAGLAGDSRLQVTLFRAYVPRVGDQGDEREFVEVADELRSLQSRFPEHANCESTVQRVVRLGGIDTAILDAAEEVGAAAIAMATHGHSARYHVVAGSVALGVLKRAAVPVLLVRSQAEAGDTGQASRVSATT